MGLVRRCSFRRIYCKANVEVAQVQSASVLLVLNAPPVVQPLWRAGPEAPGYTGGRERVRLEIGED